MNVYNYSTNIFIYTRIYLQNGECIFMYSTYIYIHTCNPNDPCFDCKGPSFGGFKPQDRGHSQVPGIYKLDSFSIWNIYLHMAWSFWVYKKYTGSRCIYIYISLQKW